MKQLVLCMFLIMQVQIVCSMDEGFCTLQEWQKKGVKDLQEKIAQQCAKTSLQATIDEIDALAKCYYYLPIITYKLQSPEYQKQLSEEEEKINNVQRLGLDAMRGWFYDRLRELLRNAADSIQRGDTDATTVIQELLCKKKNYGARFLFDVMKQDPNADVGYYDGWSGTPVPALFIPHSLPIAKLLIQCGADVTKKVDNDFPLVHRFGENEMYTPELLQYYLTCPGFDYTGQDNQDRDTVLHIAAAKASKDVSFLTKLSMLLLQKNLDVNVMNKKGKTALDYLNDVALSWYLPKNDKKNLIILFRAAGARTAEELRALQKQS